MYTFSNYQEYIAYSAQIKNLFSFEIVAFQYEELIIITKLKTSNHLPTIFSYFLLRQFEKICGYLSDDEIIISFYKEISNSSISFDLLRKWGYTYHPHKTYYIPYSDTAIYKKVTTC